ncbi:hypothetical protein JCM19274_4197 [Algibacter lectus]|uniref:Uncharacterized protein n=1 Tax=Algibacter lectus TaxID=221126 RepID=A0A090X589_9FLAO|nr:hypothetical protein JCM19274_4197 [Algibacter lectus]
MDNFVVFMLTLSNFDWALRETLKKRKKIMRDNFKNFMINGFT